MKNILKKLISKILLSQFVQTHWNKRWFKILFPHIFIKINNSKELQNNYKIELQRLNHKIEVLDEFVLDNKRTIQHPKHPNTILIIEPNPYHGEVLLGIIKYFIDLGYNVELLLQKDLYDEQLFYNIDEKYRPDITTFETFNLLFLFLLQAKFENYTMVFANTNIISTIEYQLSIMPYIYTTSPIYAYLHKNEFLYTDTDKKLYDNNHFIKLLPMSGFSHVTPFYFGEQTPNNKNTTLQLSIIGALDNITKDFSDLNKILSMETQAFNIVSVGYNHFTTKNKNFVSLGRCNFPDMYQQVQNSDFILMLLSSANDNHTKYKSDTISGSNQLSLGFCKPLIVERAFADFYGWDESTAIIYEVGEISQAVLYAMNMSNDEYLQMCHAIKKRANNIYQDSLNNLKDCLRGNHA